MNRFDDKMKEIIENYLKLVYQSMHWIELNFRKNNHDSLENVFHLIDPSHSNRLYTTVSECRFGFLSIVQKNKLLCKLLDDPFPHSHNPNLQALGFHCNRQEGFLHLPNKHL